MRVARHAFAPIGGIGGGFQQGGGVSGTVGHIIKHY